MENTETLICTMKLNSNLNVEEFNNLASQLNVTLGNKLKPLSIQKHYKYETKTFYICKNPGFDEALQVLIPYLTEDLFISKLNDNDSLCYISDVLTDNVLKIKEVIVENLNEIDFYTFKLEIIATDIEPNFNLIIELLQKAEHYLKI